MPSRPSQPQELALSAKPGLLAAIDELEKMTGGLKDALKEELTAAVEEARQAALAEAEEGEQAAPPSAPAASGGQGRTRISAPERVDNAHRAWPAKEL